MRRTLSTASQEFEEASRRRPPSRKRSDGRSGATTLLHKNDDKLETTHMDLRLPAFGHRVEVTFVRVEVIETHVILSAIERNPPEGQRPKGYISV